MFQQEKFEIDANENKIKLAMSLIKNGFVSNLEDCFRLDTKLAKKKKYERNWISILFMKQEINWNEARFLIKFKIWRNSWFILYHIIIILKLKHVIQGRTVIEAKQANVSPLFLYLNGYLLLFYYFYCFPFVINYTIDVYVLMPHWIHADTCTYMHFMKLNFKIRN